MKIVADENIPLINHYFGQVGELTLKPGRLITHHDVKDADILLTRSVTKIDKALLQNTSVKFVGCVTTGTDHIDTKWLHEAGIECASATGCNAIAVKEYVLCVIAALQSMNFLTGTKLRAGVIGVGRIGSLVAEELKLMGFDVLLCDPIRAGQDSNFISVPLKEMTDLDFITLHTPLTFDGPHPTYHMIDKNFLNRQKAGCVLLNAGRGDVIKSEDLLNSSIHSCLDVWENEPEIDKDLLKKTLIATPHIAGYSVQSKYRGIDMIYRIAANKKFISSNVKSPEFPRQKILIKNDANEQKDILQIYNPLHTSRQMKADLLSNHDTFDNLRKNFIERHEFAYVTIFKSKPIENLQV